MGRIFNDKEYLDDSIHWSKESANERAKKIREQGGLARITVGSTTITHSVYYKVWECGSRR